MSFDILYKLIVMKILLVPLILLTTFQGISCQTSTNIDDDKLSRYLIDNYLSPEDYILKEFNHHQIIFIGEFHRIKCDVELIQNLIPLLYKNGIYILAIEFAVENDQHLIDSLITSPLYDQQLAEKILFNQFVFWGYKEYADIFKSAWQLNNGLDVNKRKFRILGINCSADWSIVKTEADFNNVELRKKAWGGCGEKNWAEVISKEIIDKNEKGLVYCGLHHAFTEYLYPIYNVRKDTLYRYEDDRVGRYIYNLIGKNSITIFLHSPFPSDRKTEVKYVQPFDGKIERVISMLPKKYQRIGFDINDSPFAEIKSTNSYYKFGYGNFCAGDFCDGYIFQKPINDFEGVNVIDGFINNNNINTAKEQSPDPDFKTATIEEFMKSITESANIKQRFANVK